MENYLTHHFQPIHYWRQHSSELLCPPKRSLDLFSPIEMFLSCRLIHLLAPFKENIAIKVRYGLSSLKLVLASADFVSVQTRAFFSLFRGAEKKFAAERRARWNMVSLMGGLASISRGMKEKGIKFADNLCKISRVMFTTLLHSLSPFFHL